MGTHGLCYAPKGVLQDQPLHMNFSPALTLIETVPKCIFSPRKEVVLRCQIFNVAGSCIC